MNKLPLMKNDSAKVKLLNELGRYFMVYSESNKAGYNKAILYLTEADHLNDSLYTTNSPGRFTSKILLARSYLLAKQLSEGQKLFKHVLNYYRDSGDKKSEADMLLRYALALDLSDTEGVSDEVFATVLLSAKLYREMGNIPMEIEARIENATYAFRLGSYDVSAKELISLVDISRANNCFQLVSIFHKLATLHRYKGELNTALSYCLAAVKTAEELHDTSERDALIGELALEYGELGKSEESIRYYKECIALREQKRISQYVIYRTATLMTSEMIKIHRGKEGYEFLRELKQRSSPHGERENAVIEHGLANCLAASGKEDEAERHYLSMLGSYERLDRTEARASAQLDAIKFFVQTNRFKRAEQYHDTLNNIVLGSLVMHRDVEFCLFKVDSARKNYTEAIRHIQRFKEFNDSIFNREKSQQIEALHIRYSSEQKDQNITLLKKQTELQQANLSQSETLRNSLIAGTIMLILLLGLLYNRYRLKIKNNLLLEKQREEISRKNFAQQLLLNEKDWLVREIHHRVKNNFHMVVGLMGTQSAYIKSSEALQALEDSKHRIHTMSLIHQKLYQSENLSATMMSDYIYELVSYLKDSFDVSHVLFKIECEPIELELSYSLPLGLILNEAITNSIKYAFPGNQEGTIQISLKHVSVDKIQLVIRDNGIGIPLKNDSSISSSMGMNLMKGLTEDIGGISSITNDNGTIIQIDFSYDATKYSNSEISEDFSIKYPL